MTTLSFVALALAVVAVALLVARLRQLRRELDAALGDAASARARTEEAELAHRRQEASAQEQLAASAARAAEVEEAMARQAADAEARLAELDQSSRQRIGQLERSRDQAAAELRQATAAAAARAADAEAARRRADELEEAAVAARAGQEAASVAARAELEATASRLAALEAELAAGRPAPAAPAAGPEPAPAPRGDDAGWRLLLARVERQWADLVNAGPEERGVVDGSRSEQLVQAAQRELERLREEVGVETAMAVTGPVGAEHALTTLLVVGEAAALLASRSEHVSVELGDRTVVTGRDWAGDDDARRRLDQLVASASAAGRPAAVEPGDGAVRVVFG